MKEYRPKRARKQWLVDAPEYILDVFDNPNFADRYTVLFGGSLFDPALLKDRKVMYLAMSDSPTSPNGVSMWGECASTWRPSNRRIRWLDLPEHIRKHVIMRVENE